MFGEKISQQDDYNYLGLLFNYNGNFYKARKKLVDQAQKALYSLYKQIVIKTISYKLRFSKLKLLRVSRPVLQCSVRNSSKSFTNIDFTQDLILS
jgi:hypothetical protein